MRAAKIKAKIKDDAINIKFVINNIMLTEKRAQKLNIEQDYITHIIIRVKERILFEFRPSGNITDNPLFKFKVKKKELKLGDIIDLEWTTLLSKTQHYTKKIK